MKTMPLSEVKTKLSELVLALARITHAQRKNYDTVSIEG